MGADSLTAHLLIAMPRLEDPNFSRTVTYLCEHGPEGALGIVVNRPLPGVSLGQILAKLDIDCPDPAVAARAVYRGGPVQGELGFVLHSPPGEWQATHAVCDAVGVTTSRDVLEAIASGGGPPRTLVAFGYAGWGPGQLEQEIAQNSWLHAPGDLDVLFHLPDEERWHAAAELLGVDLQSLTVDAGHA